MSDKNKIFNKKESVLEEITDEIVINGNPVTETSKYEEETVDLSDEKSVVVEAEEDVTDSVAKATDHSENQEKNAKNKLATVVYDAVSTIIGAFIIVSLVFVFLFRLVGVDGESMTNTLQHKDMLLAMNKSEYVQGDIVVITQDTYFHTPLIKRVIAVGGQTIDIDYETATVYVDGVALDEPYIKEDYILVKMDDCDFPYTVPQGTLFCMGDNRNGSTDSRSSLVGPIDERQIMGKAIVRVVPFGDFDIYDYE